MIFTPSERAYLSTQRLGRMATVQPSGTLQVSPVGFRLADDDTIEVVGYDLETSQKFRNIRADGRVAFVVDDIASVTPWRVRCVEVRGTAEAVDAPTALIRIHPRRVISFGIDEPDTEAHDLTVSARNVV